MALRRDDPERQARRGTTRPPGWLARAWLRIPDRLDFMLSLGALVVLALGVLIAGLIAAL